MEGVTKKKNKKNIQICNLLTTRCDDKSLYVHVKNEAAACTELVHCIAVKRIKFLRWRFNWIFSSEIIITQVNEEAIVSCTADAGVKIRQKKKKKSLFNGWARIL